MTTTGRTVNDVLAEASERTAEGADEREIEEVLTDISILLEKVVSWSRAGEVQA